MTFLQLKKPTFFNMHESLDSLSLGDFTINGRLNFPEIESFLGSNVDLDWLLKFQLAEDVDNNWIWWPKSLNVSIVSAVYAFLNDDPSSTPWKGWKNIWKLDVPPRVKTFMWKLAHNKIPTCDVFYNLNFGPRTYYHFCHLVPETSARIFWGCPYIINCWKSSLNSLGLSEAFISTLRSGNWLVFPFKLSCNINLGRAVIAITHWQIQKARCNIIFKYLPLNLDLIHRKVWCLALEYAKHPKPPHRELSLSNTLDPITIFSDASWTSAPMQIYTNCISILKLIKNPHAPATWRLSARAYQLLSLLNILHNPRVDFIDPEENMIAECISLHAYSNPDLSLFAKGMQLPFWLYDVCTNRAMLF